MHARPLARIVAIAVIALVGGGATHAATEPANIAYGSNPAAGKYFRVLVALASTTRRTATARHCC
jgi:hypothetical protein